MAQLLFFMRIWLWFSFVSEPHNTFPVKPVCAYLCHDRLRLLAARAPGLIKVGISTLTPRAGMSRFRLRSELGKVSPSEVAGGYSRPLTPDASPFVRRHNAASLLLVILETTPKVPLRARRQGYEHPLYASSEPPKERARACERWSFVLHLFTCPPPPPRAPTGVRRPTGCACRSVVQKMGPAKHYPAKHLSKGIYHRVSDVSGLWGPVCGPSGLRRIHTPWTGAFCKPAHCVVAPAWGLRGQTLSEELLVSWVGPPAALRHLIPHCAWAPCAPSLSPRAPFLPQAELGIRIVGETCSM